MQFQSEKLGDLTVIKELGAGNFGVTYLVSSADGCHYVVKLLKIQDVDRWKVIERFEREAAALAQLKHPGIPEFYDTVEVDGAPGIVQGYIEGETLAEIIAGNRLLGGDEWGHCFDQGIAILDYLKTFQPPVIHRDISPKNMILTPDGKLYLIDFGGVQIALTENSETVTTLGTFGYMAPEQIMGITSPKSDLYSFGMTMLALGNRMEAGRFPFDLNSGRVDIEKLLNHIPERYRNRIRGMTRPAVGQRGLEVVSKQPQKAGKSVEKPPHQIEERLSVDYSFKMVKGDQQELVFGKKDRVDHFAATLDGKRLRVKWYFNKKWRRIHSTTGVIHYLIRFGVLSGLLGAGSPFIHETALFFFGLIMFAVVGIWCYTEVQNYKIELEDGKIKLGGKRPFTATDDDYFYTREGSGKLYLQHYNREIVVLDSSNHRDLRILATVLNEQLRGKN